MPTPSRAIPDRNAVNVQWLISLRWAQIVGQAATILGVRVGFGLVLPVGLLAIVVGVGCLSNLALALYGFGSLRAEGAAVRPISEWQLAGVMALDVALLTVMLALTGGPLNPFGFLYLVQIALATVLLRAVWAWALVAMSFTGYGVLLVAHRTLVISERTHTYGVWVALGVASGFIVHFLLRVATSLAQREAELDEARNLAARQERLASLATMAAGAAHELSTPLSTVALVAKELERHLGKLGDPQLVEDARLIRGEVGRCRVILDQMAGGAGTIGEGVDSRTVDELLAESLSNVRARPPVRRDVAPAVALTRVRLPPRAVSQALRSLVTNAQDASPDGPTAEVVVRVDLIAAQPPRLRIAILDWGPGMHGDVLARIGEPFYTTKAPGRGMGLGLFLARAVVEGVGGSLVVESAPGRGTTVTVSVPVDVAPERAESAQMGEARSAAMVSNPP